MGASSKKSDELNRVSSLCEMTTHKMTIKTQECEMEVLSKLKEGDVIVTAQHGLKAFGTIPIRFGNYFKRGYDYRMWTHSAIYVGGGEIVEALPSGIVKKKFMDAYGVKSDIEYVVLRRTTLSENDAKKVVLFCTEQVGNKYDKKALTYFLLVNLMPPTLSFILDSSLLNRCLNTDKAYFCSELVASALLKSQDYCFDRAPYHVMPVDFYNEYGFLKVYEKIDNTKSNKFQKFITAIGYVFMMLLWTVILILLAVVVWSAILWIWNLILARSKEKLMQNKSDERRDGAESAGS